MQGPPCPFELGCGAVPIFGAQCHVIFDVLVLCDLYKPVRGTLVPLMTRTSKTLKVKAKLMEGLGRSPSVFDLVDTWAIITVSTPRRTWKGSHGGPALPMEGWITFKCSKKLCLHAEGQVQASLHTTQG